MSEKNAMVFLVIKQRGEMDWALVQPCYEMGRESPFEIRLGSQIGNVETAVSVNPVLLV